MTIKYEKVTETKEVKVCTGVECSKCKQFFEQAREELDEGVDWHATRDKSCVHEITGIRCYEKVVDVDCGGSIDGWELHLCPDCFAEARKLLEEAGFHFEHFGLVW